jgi:hypothetical protein
MKLHVLGVDLGKTVFHLVGLDSAGKVVIRKRCSRRQLLAFTANLQVQLIGMEVLRPQWARWFDLVRRSDLNLVKWKYQLRSFNVRQDFGQRQGIPRVWFDDNWGDRQPPTQSGLSPLFRKPTLRGSRNTLNVRDHSSVILVFPN